MNSSARRSLVALLVLALGCGRGGDDGARPGGRPASDTLQRDVRAPETFSYAFVRGADTVAIEEVGVAGDVIEGEMRELDTQQRMTYVAIVGEHAFTRIELTLYDPAAPSQAVVTGFVEIRGDSAYSEQHARGAVTRDTRPVPEGTGVYLNPSMGQLEHILRRVLPDDAVQRELSVLALSAAEPPRLTSPALRRIGTDSLAVTLDGETSVRLHIDPEGRILGGEAPGGLRIVRRPDTP